MTELETQNAYEFGEFRLAPDERLLRRGGEVVRLPPKVVDLLLALVESGGRVLSKDELMRQVWPDAFVEESNLTHNVALLRRALGEKTGGQKFIETIPRRGYRFVAEVRQAADENLEIIARERTVTSVVTEEELEISDDQSSSPKPVSAVPSKRHRLKFNRAAAVLLGAVAAAVILGVGAFVWRQGRRNQAGAPPNFSVKRLTTNGRVGAAALSPDGKFVVFAEQEKDGESLWLRQMQTGSQTRILPPQAVQFVGLTVSPDSNFVYCSVFFGHKADTELWRLPILGGVPQTIPNFVTGTAISFSPDGRRFAFTASHSPQTFVKIAAADGTNERVLLRADSREGRAFPIFDAGSLAWSPDGAEIACATDEATPDGKRAGILLVNPEGGGEKFLVAPRWTFITHLAWLDDENLAFIGYQADEWRNQIYTVSRQSGQIRPLTSDTNGYAWLSSAGGNLVAVQKTSNSSLLVLEDSESSVSDSGKTPAPKENPRADGRNPELPDAREILSESGVLTNVAWAADGSILYSSSASGRREIWRVGSDGSNPTQLTVDAEISYGLAVSLADGAMVFCRDREGKRSIWTADADGKNLRPVTDGDEDLWADFAPDGRTIFFQRGFDSNLKTVWRVTPGGEPSQLTKTTSTHPQASPDGRQIAYFSMDSEANRWQINLISAETGEVLRALNLPDSVVEHRMAWHPSGEFLTLGSRRGENVSLISLPVNGGPARHLADLGKGEVGALAWSRDGRRLAAVRASETRDVVLFGNVN